LQAGCTKLEKPTELRKSIFLGLGLTAILTGVALFAFASDSGKLVGIVLASLGVLFFNPTRVTNQTSPSGYHPPITQLEAPRSSWPFAVACGVLIAGSFYVLHLDALHGHDELTPVLFFAFSGLCGMAYLIYIFGRTSG